MKSFFMWTMRTDQNCLEAWADMSLLQMHMYAGTFSHLMALRVTYRIQPNYRTVRLGFFKITGKTW